MNMDGRRPRGSPKRESPKRESPKQRWQDTINIGLKISGLKQSAADNRKKWRSHSSRAGPAPAG